MDVFEKPAFSLRGWAFYWENKYTDNLRCEIDQLRGDACFFCLRCYTINNNLTGDNRGK